ncbi:hypothetical protein MIND_00879000 [Mycena indigotica]|uniref:Fungal-type protein kinase domain-containing protein n=1 Tax=Mycena indigotica TaxID=2126181 RepID=A0A8H6SGR2_9AGAR|nr:uncharacterized protein MIND_00879000 [Mycena indigotica]KAF7299300.1 hypothetical protein MIND_00879000 [Mycena indigotica]
MAFDGTSTPELKTSHLINLLSALVSTFPSASRPLFAATHDTQCVSKSAPDVIGSAPGLSEPPGRWDWQQIDVVFKQAIPELERFDLVVKNWREKSPTRQEDDVFRTGQRLLLAGHSNRAFVVALDLHTTGTTARIIEFSRTDFVLGEVFDLGQDTQTLPALFHRLYRVEQPPRSYCSSRIVLMKNLFDILQLSQTMLRDPAYKRLFTSFRGAHDSTLVIQPAHKTPCCTQSLECLELVPIPDIYRLCLLKQPYTPSPVYRVIFRPLPTPSVALPQSRHSRRTRCLLRTIGCPMYAFPTPSHLLHGMQTSLFAHMRAFQVGVMHGDITPTNLVADDTTFGLPAEQSRALLFDFDDANPAALPKGTQMDPADAKELQEIVEEKFAMARWLSQEN